MQKWFVRGKDGKPVEVTQEQFLRLAGDRTTAPYAGKVYQGNISIEEVPEDIRQAVADIVAAKTEFYGEYEIPAKEALAELKAVLA